MAQFSADILLNVSSTAAERAVRKLESQITRLDRKAGSIDLKFNIDDREIRRADRLLSNLERVRRVRVRVEEQRISDSGGSSSSASNAGAAVAGLLPAAATAAAIKQIPNAMSAAARSTKALNAALEGSESSLEQIVGLSQQSILNVDSLSRAYDKVVNAQDRLRDQQDKIAQKQAAIAQRSTGAIGGRSVNQLKNDLNTLTKKQDRLNKEVEESITEYVRVRDITEQVDSNLEEAITKQRRLNQAAKQFISADGGGRGALPPSGGGRGGRGGVGPAPAAAAGALSGLRGSIAATVAGLVGLNEAIQETGRIISATLERTQGEQRIRALSQGFNDYREVLDLSSAAAEKFNLSQNQANEAFGQLFGRLRPLGLTLEEINTVYEGFNTAAVLSGTTATEAAGAMLQLSQALGSGALRGDEFNSIAEQTPAVTRAIAKELNVPIGRLKELAKEGRITSDVVVNALARIRTEGAVRLASALDTPTQKVQTLTNRFEDLRVEIGKTTLPAFLTIVDGGTVVVEKLTDRVEKLGKAFAFINRILPDFNINLEGVFDRLVENLPTVGKYVKVLNTVLNVLSALEDKEQEIAASSYDTTQGAGLDMDLIRQMSQDAQGKSLQDRLGIEDPTEKVKDRARGLSDVLTGSDLGKLELETSKRLLENQLLIEDAVRANDKLERQRLESLREQIPIETEILFLQRKYEAIADATNKLLKDGIAQKEIDNELQTITNKIQERSNQLEEANSRQVVDRLENEREITKERERQLQALIDAARIPSTGIAGQRQDTLKDLQRVNEFGAEGADFINRVERLVLSGEMSFSEAFQLEESINQLRALNEATDEFNQLLGTAARAAGDAIADSIGVAIDAAITGADDLASKLQNIASNLLKDVGMMFIRAGISGLGGPGGLFGPAGLPGFANGGVVPMGTTAVVGERGPEILTVRPNGTDVIPNSPFADAAAAMSTPSASTAFADAGEAMEMATATTMANLTTRQEQQAMAAAAAQSTSSSIVVQTTLVDEIEVVTLDQLNKATQASAKQAEANVMRGLRNRPATRSRAGVK